MPYERGKSKELKKTSAFVEEKKNFLASFILIGCYSGIDFVMVVIKLKQKPRMWEREG